MMLKIEPSNGLAIYDQVVRQVKFAIADGALREGELTPSVRELSKDLAINPNTVARAYQQLQADNVLEAVRGRGLIVKRRAVQRCRKQRQSLIQERLSEALREAIASGLSETEVRELIDQQFAALLQRQRDSKSRAADTETAGGDKSDHSSTGAEP